MTTAAAVKPAVPSVGQMTYAIALSDATLLAALPVVTGPPAYDRPALVLAGASRGGPAWAEASDDLLGSRL